MIKELLKKMCLIDKATLLNLLMREVYSKTALASCSIAKILENYNKETNMIIDSYLWKLYGLHYKDYIDTSLASCGLCTYDVIKLDKAIDRKIIYYMESKEFPE
jgi:hypothetical protein